MAGHIDQFVPLREVVFMYSEAAKKSDAEYLRLWRLAFRGFSQMGMNAFWQPKTISIPVNSNKTVTLPKDYIQWIRVGQIVGNQIVTLKNNQSLFSSTSTYQGVADVVGSDMWFSGYVPVGRSAGCSTIDFKIANNCILLNTAFEGSNILLEYLCSPQSDEGFSIPVQFQEAMIAWLGWQDINYTPATSHMGNSNKQMLMLNFRAQSKLAKKMFKPFRLSEVIGGYAEFNQSEALSNDEITTPTITTFNIEWDWVDGAISEPFTQDLSQVATFNIGDPISLLITNPSRHHYLEIRYPITESKKSSWANTPLNYGTMGDQVFLPTQSNETHRCIVSRVPVQLDNSTPTIFT